MRKSIFALTILFWSVLLHAQDTVFVNTDKLVLRDRPEKVYNVKYILNAACPLIIGPDHDIGYINDKAVMSRFCKVHFSFKDDQGCINRIGGWVEKKYLVNSLARVNFPGADKSPGRPPGSLSRRIPLDNDCHEFNAALFPPPKYKGAELQPKEPKRAYHNGPRGGCYYKNAKGTKVYVDKAFCK